MNLVKQRETLEAESKVEDDKNKLDDDYFKIEEIINDEDITEVCEQSEKSDKTSTLETNDSRKLPQAITCCSRKAKQKDERFDKPILKIEGSNVTVPISRSLTNTTNMVCYRS